MKQEDLIALAVGLAIGTITEDYIAEKFGDSVLTDVLALSGASVVTTATTKVASSIIDSASDIVGDVADSINPFKW